MKRLLAIAATAAATITLTAAVSAATPTQFKLMAQNGSGETATATLLQSGPDLIVIVRTENGGDADQPVHIHKGTCDHLDPKPVYPLKTIINGRSETKVMGVSLSDLLAGTYAINIHKSTTDLKDYVACGDLKVATK